MSGKTTKEKKKKDIIKLLREQGYNKKEVRDEVLIAAAIVCDMDMLEAGYTADKAATVSQTFHDKNYDLVLTVTRKQHSAPTPAIKQTIIKH